jgi:hypothetical protein
MNARQKKIIRRAAEIAALGALVVLFLKTLDIRDLREQAIGIPLSAMPVLIGFQTALLGLGAFGWSLLLKEADIYRGPRRTFLSRIGGFSATYLTPSISFSGIPARAAIYLDSSIEKSRLYSTIALDSFIEIAGKIPCIAAGFFLLLLLARPGLPLALAGGGVLAALLGVCILLLRKILAGPQAIIGFLQGPLRLLAGPAPRLARRILAKSRTFADTVSSIAGGRRTFRKALLVSFAVSLLETAQAGFILWTLGCPSVSHSFILYSTVLIHGVIGVLPGNIGGMEGAYMLAFTLLGLDPGRGVLFALLLRSGQLTMALAGILVIAFRRIVKKTRISRSAAVTDAH